MDLILAEQLLLILLDDESGAEQAGWGKDPGIAGALLLDLANDGAVYERDGKLAADPGRRPERPLLADAHRAIEEIQMAVIFAATAAASSAAASGGT